MSLNHKQSVFVAEYLIDMNATQAAIRAGYSEKTAGSQAFDLLRKPEIQEAISLAMEERAKRTDITQDRVLLELAKIGFSDIRKAVAWGPEVQIVDPDTGETAISNGVALIASGSIDDDTAAAVSEISQTAQGIKIKLHDKRAALVDIGKHLGMFRDKLELTGKDGGPVESANKLDYSGLTEEQIRALASIKLNS